MFPVLEALCIPFVKCIIVNLIPQCSSARLALCKQDVGVSSWSIISAKRMVRSRLLTMDKKVLNSFEALPLLRWYTSCASTYSHKCLSDTLSKVLHAVRWKWRIEIFMQFATLEKAPLSSSAKDLLWFYRYHDMWNYHRNSRSISFGIAGA